MTCILSSGPEPRITTTVTTECRPVLDRSCAVGEREISDDLESTTVTINGNSVRPRQSVATLQDLSLYSHRLALRGIQWSYCDVRQRGHKGAAGGVN